MKRHQRVVDVGQEAEQLSLCFPTSYSFSFSLESDQLDLFEWAKQWKARRLMEHMDVVRRLASEIAREGWNREKICEYASKRGAEITLCRPEVVKVKSRGFTSVLSQLNDWSKILSYTYVGEGHVQAAVLP